MLTTFLVRIDHPVPRIRVFTWKVRKQAQFKLGFLKFTHQLVALWLELQDFPMKYINIFLQTEHFKNIKLTVYK